MGTSIMAKHANPRLLITTLIFVTAMMAVISSLGAPLINTVAVTNKISLSTAEWTLTAALLTSAIATPIMGRLADGPRQRRVVLVGLAIVIIGLIIAALSKDFKWLLIGRSLQGVGMGLAPVTMAIARNQLDIPMSAKTIGTLSVTSSACVGLGYSATSLIAEKYNYHVSFWCASSLVIISFVVAWAVIPKFTNQQKRSFDLVGATLLTFSLIGILAVLGEGEVWGWTSPLSISVAACGIILGIFWVFYSLHKKDALVNLHLSSTREVVAVNVTGFLISISMYMFVPVIVEFVQIPKITGMGFGSSILTSGLLLVPLSITTLGSSKLIPFAMKYLSSRIIIPLGCSVFALASFYFAIQHSSLWQAFVTIGIAGVGLGFTFGAMPGYIVRSVPDGETGNALGIFQLVRSIGLSIGSAVAGTLLAHYTFHNQSFPSLKGFTTVLYVGSGMLAIAAITSYFLLESTNGGSSPKKDELERMKENPGISGLP